MRVTVLPVTAAKNKQQSRISLTPCNLPAPETECPTWMVRFDEPKTDNQTCGRTPFSAGPGNPPGKQSPGASSLTTENRRVSTAGHVSHAIRFVRTNPDNPDNVSEHKLPCKPRDIKKLGEPPNPIPANAFFASDAATASARRMGMQRRDGALHGSASGSLMVSDRPKDLQF